MATMLRVLSWKVEGLRCPDHEIDCLDRNGSPFGVTLIQMPNGTGKTTTLSLLRAALSGPPEDDRESKKWQAGLAREMKKRHSDGTEGVFELRLALNEKPLTIVMEFDFESERVDYKTTWRAGQTPGFKPPLELRRFMNKDFVDFYVFDGELAEKLLDPKHTNAEQAVETLFQVHLLGRMKDEVDRYWDRKTRSVTAKDDRGHTRRHNLLEKWRRRLDELQEQKHDLDAKLEEIDGNLGARNAWYRQEISKQKKLQERLESAEDAVGQRENEVEDHVLTVLDGMRDPHALSVDCAAFMNDLKVGLDRVKLPETAAREFFEELSEEEECVCGRPIDEEIRPIIRSRALQYLGSDDMSLLNSLKHDVSSFVGEAPDQAETELAGKIAALSDRVIARQDARNELDSLKHEAEKSDPNVGKAAEEIERLEREKEKVQEALKRFEGKDSRVDLARLSAVSSDSVHAIASVKEVVAELERQVEEITNTLRLRNRRDLLGKMLEHAHEMARREIASEVRDEANTCIERMMPQNNIRIETINQSLVLRGQAGGSAGETLSVGYAFLSTLFNRADHHQLPFIVDSPAGPIDYDIRPKIAEIMPHLTGQFIAFMISSEREKFLPNLRRAADSEIQYITLFRKGAPHLEEKAQAVASCVETGDGFHVADEEFFEDFQLDDEDE